MAFAASERKLQASISLGFISLESDQTLFYPRWLKELRGKPGGELLPYYGTQLDTIEMTSSNYHIPTPSEARAWAQAVPPGFVMHIKIFCLFSFGTCQASSLPPSARAMLKLPPTSQAVCKLKKMKVDVVEEVWRCFTLALDPLQEQGKLGLVMSQFTGSFVPCYDNYKHLKDICCRITPARLAAEFRNPSWERSPEARQVLQELQVVVVLSDDNGSYNYNNNFRGMVSQLRGQDLGYCRIHRRPTNRETGLICENVSRADIEASMQVDATTGLSSGDLRSTEVQEWSHLLRAALDAMKPGGRIFVLFSTVGRNSSADNVARFRVSLKDYVRPWPNIDESFASQPGDSSPVPNRRASDLGHLCDALCDVCGMNLSSCGCAGSAEDSQQVSLSDAVCTRKTRLQEEMELCSDIVEEGHTASKIKSDAIDTRTSPLDVNPARRNRWNRKGV